MEETFADTNLKGTSPFGGTEPSEPSQQAASDLRAAAGDKAKQIAHDAGAKAQQLKQTAVDKAQQLREFAGNKASDIKENASAKAQHIRQVAGEQLHHGRVKAREIHTDTEEYIRQHPTKAVLTALGVGFVIGLAIRR